MSCILPLLEDMKVVKTKTSSDSIIVFGTLANKEVVLKIAPEPQGDNALERERDIYMYVQRELLPLTPHFAPGIATGKCDLAETLNALGTDGANKLHEVRGQLLLNILSPDEIER